MYLIAIIGPITDIVASRSKDQKIGEGTYAVVYRG